MAFPDEVLTDEEEVVLHLHPHWKTAIRPALVAMLALATTAFAWVMLPQNTGGFLAFAVVAGIMGYYGIRYGVGPLVAWRCTHYVVTDERILLQDGVIARERRDLPLNRINDHLLTQSLLDRLFGCGTLTIDSIGDQAAVLTAVPHAHQLQTALYELIEQAPNDDEDDEETDPAPTSRNRRR
ncbi:PH domain-containing protein [Actinoplanes subtropicus]|uniref:PH domain-containing protein n=1 Tax=Actinoplanes subtropicus TaxID=543632 RepID=UPI0006902CAE|nr:PH domain-containing protein [Actinoplanes subtropicus]